MVIRDRNPSWRSLARPAEAVSLEGSDLGDLGLRERLTELGHDRGDLLVCVAVGRPDLVLEAL